MAIYSKYFIICIFIIVSCVYNGNAQILVRTNSEFDFSALSINSEFKDINYAEKLNIEESIYYRNRYNKESNERTVYSIFTVYKNNTTVGFCPYGIDFDLMSERFNKNKANTFRYWNKIRMAFKFLVEKNLNDPTEKPIDYFIPQAYFLFLHLPQSARGDLTTKARKGSYMFYFMTTPLKRSLVYLKFNVGSIWIKPYFKQDSRFYNKMENYSGINLEFEINKNGYNHSIVQSSRDIYRGITLFGGTEYNLSKNRIILNFGLLVTTENH